MVVIPFILLRVLILFIVACVLTLTTPSICPDTTTAFDPRESLQLWLTSIALHFDVARIAVVVASQRPRCRSHTCLLFVAMHCAVRALLEVLGG